MKNKEKKIILKDVVPEVKVVSISSLKPALIKKAKDPTFSYHSSKRNGRSAFISSEYDLSEIGRAEDTESYLRQAFVKKIALMFKEGWAFEGNNPKTLKYVKARLVQIAQASGIPTQQLLKTVGSSLIRKSNAFIIKSRKKEASGGRVRRDLRSNRTLNPVAGYFPAPAETMRFSLKNESEIQGWQQVLPSGLFKDFKEENVVHVFWDKKDGFRFGTPSVIPVLDDIRALRKIEENIELLVYQHLFPLFQYKVGTEKSPAGYSETGEKEVDIVRQEIMYMPTEGGIVTPERHEIKAIGAEGKALDATNYLEHFKKRVFAGLGVSSVDMGDGANSNKSTADTMSRNLVDSVKDFQQTLEMFFNEFIVNELLLESTFGDDVLSQDNIVRLKFKEIDVNAQIKREAHSADLFNKNIISHDESRIRLGLEPIDFPDMEAIRQDLDISTSHPEWSKLNWRAFKYPEAMIFSKDEVLMQDGSTPVPLGMDTQPQERGTPKTASNVPDEENKKAQEKPDVSVVDSSLKETYESVKIDTSNYFSSNLTPDNLWVKRIIESQLTAASEKLILSQMVEFKKEYTKYADSFSVDFIISASLARKEFGKRTNRYINRLVKAIQDAISRQENKTKPTIEAVFDSVGVRISLIEEIEIKKAKNLGAILSHTKLKDKEKLRLVASSSACAQCKIAESLFTVDSSDISNIPPHHPNCNCSIEKSL